LRLPRSTWPELFAPVAELQLELPALERRHNAAEFVPGDLATIDDDHRHSVVSVGIAVDSAAQRQAIVHLRPMFGLLEVGESQRWAQLADEPAQQLRRIVVWLPDHLKPIPGLAATAQLVRVDCDAGVRTAIADPRGFDELDSPALPADRSSRRRA
jgi:hypothetical protein